MSSIPHVVLLLCIWYSSPQRILAVTTIATTMQTALPLPTVEAINVSVRSDSLEMDSNVKVQYVLSGLSIKP